MKEHPLIACFEICLPFIGIFCKAKMPCSYAPAYTGLRWREKYN